MGFLFHLVVRLRHTVCTIGSCSIHVSHTGSQAGCGVWATSNHCLVGSWGWFVKAVARPGSCATGIAVRRIFGTCVCAGQNEGMRPIIFGFPLIVNHIDCIGLGSGSGSGFTWPSAYNTIGLGLVLVSREGTGCSNSRADYTALEAGARDLSCPASDTI